VEDKNNVRNQGRTSPVSKFRQEVATWNTRQLLKAVTTEGNLFTDNEVSSMDSELRRRRVAVPLKCPLCDLIIHSVGPGVPRGWKFLMSTLFDNSERPL